MTNGFVFLKGGANMKNAIISFVTLVISMVISIAVVTLLAGQLGVKITHIVSIPFVIEGILSLMGAFLIWPPPEELVNGILEKIKK